MELKVLCLQYIGILPFYINVEMPSVCHQGEQIGVRVTIFNYMTNDLEAVVVLGSSTHYKFVHVEMNGIVSVCLSSKVDIVESSTVTAYMDESSVT